MRNTDQRVDQEKYGRSYDSIFKKEIQEKKDENLLLSTGRDGGVPHVSK